MQHLQKNIKFSKIDWKKVNGLIPAIVQDKNTFQVLMLGYMNEESLRISIETGKVTFFSRSKNRIWQKGETSKNYLHIFDIKLDCDNDTLLIFVEPVGNTCHLETYSCFAERKKTDLAFLNQLQDTIKNRSENPQKSSYVSSLFEKGLNKIAQKVGEEGVEVVIAALNESQDEFKNEVADLLFHLLVLLEKEKVALSEVIEVLQKRGK